MSTFPSLYITANRVDAQGAFATAQAAFLSPHPDTVAELDALLQANNVGVVAHFYMDAELQGILSACTHPHIFVADSLLMADHAVKMVEDGVRSIVVLGVDFMSENVRAVLDSAGYTDIPVYRVDEREIGCSLAQAAESRNYIAWLQQASQQPKSVHVVYINTSLYSKAVAHSMVPTITCTSSNVLQTILQVAEEIPGVTIWYGPDSYMGHNLEVMLQQMTTMSDSEIAEVHPKHNRATIQQVLQNFQYFRQGNCIVHHMFGDTVVNTVRTEYGHAYHTAHLEVPGEMFALAVEASKQGKGVVGSTANILHFIVDKVQEALQVPTASHIPVVLGTESGMVTAIVRKVQQVLQHSNRTDITVEIIFPVAEEAVAQDETFGVLPGVAGGEGCSTSGGCATCPYMKMNSLDALFSVLENLSAHKELSALEPKKYQAVLGQTGKSVAQLGGQPILFMRHFQKHKIMDPKLVALVG